MTALEREVQLKESHLKELEQEELDAEKIESDGMAFACLFLIGSPVLTYGDLLLDREAAKRLLERQRLQQQRKEENAKETANGRFRSREGGNGDAEEQGEEEPGHSDAEDEPTRMEEEEEQASDRDEGTNDGVNKISN